MARMLEITCAQLASHPAPVACCNASNNAVGCGNACVVSLGNAFLPKLGSSFSSWQGLGMAISTRRLRAAAVSKKHASDRRSAAVVCEAQETITAAGDVNDTTFRKFVLESDIPVLVDFWAPWCGPCRMIAPLIDELARQYAGRLRCVKLNTDESPKTPTEYGIRSIPTVMIFKNGEKLDTIIGAVPKSTLTLTIEKYLP